MSFRNRVAAAMMAFRDPYVPNPGTTTWGRDKTWHRTGCLNVEIDRHGRVVSVWFRCLALPFSYKKVNDGRAEEVAAMYSEGEGDGYHDGVFELKGYRSGKLVQIEAVEVTGLQ